MAAKQATAEPEVEPSDAPGREENGATASGKTMRADARRNRERIVAAAREVFAEQGRSTCMEEIARQAGVGVGTLYRHFPSRIDVVEALYENDVHVLAEAAQRSVAELDPWSAVEAFMAAFVAYAHTKQALMAELHEAFEKNPAMRSRARELIDSSFDIVIENGKRAGVVRDDIEGSDVTQLVGPICTNVAITPEQSGRLMGMILDGLRATSAHRATA